MRGVAVHLLMATGTRTRTGRRTEREPGEETETATFIQPGSGDGGEMVREQFVRE